MSSLYTFKLNKNGRFIVKSTNFYMEILQIRILIVCLQKMLDLLVFS